jgi:hypothetical protein
MLGPVEAPVSVTSLSSAGPSTGLGTGASRKRRRAISSFAAFFPSESNGRRSPVAEPVEAPVRRRPIKKSRPAQRQDGNNGLLLGERYLKRCYD